MTMNSFSTKDSEMRIFILNLPSGLDHQTKIQ